MLTYNNQKFTITKEQANKVELKLNLSEHSHTWEKLSDDLYKISNGKILNKNIELTPEQYKYISDIVNLNNITWPTIYFYKQWKKYGEFSNFYTAPIKIDGKIWPTTEHYFQAMKFEGTTYEELVRKQTTPTDALRMGKNRRLPLRKDWETVKESVMYKALCAKFTQHADLKKLLLSTGTYELVEHTKNDRYWADGGDGTGLNRLGVLLMKVRDTL